MLLLLRLTLYTFMMVELLSFKTFLEEKEQEGGHSGYSRELMRNLGIRQKDYTAAMKADPKVVSAATAGANDFTVTPYRILDMSYDNAGNVIAAKLQLINDDKSATRTRTVIQTKSDGRRTELPPGADLDTRPFVVKVDPEQIKKNGGDPSNPSIDEILSQGMAPGGGGGMAAGGLPGGPMI